MKDANSTARRTTLRLRLATLVLSLFVLGAAFPTGAFAYLDPGTGSMMLQIALATLVGLGFTLKSYWRKIKSSLGDFLARRRRKIDPGE
jgi:hypothetical protein